MTGSKAAKMVKLITVLATIFLFALIVLSFGLYIHAGQLSAKNASLDKQIEDLSITQIALEEGIKTRSSDAYIEQQAREQLGMIKDDEEVFVID